MSNNVQVTLSCMADPRHHLRFGSCCRKFGGRDFHDVQVFLLSRLLDGESSCLSGDGTVTAIPYFSSPFSNRRWSACPYEVIHRYSSSHGAVSLAHRFRLQEIRLQIASRAVAQHHLRKYLKTL